MLTGTPALEAFRVNGSRNTTLGDTAATPSSTTTLQVSGRLNLLGTASNISNSQTFYTTADAFPLLHILPSAHNVISLNFDAYSTDGTSYFSSVTTGGNFQIAKGTSILQFNYASAAQGSAITWATGLQLNTSGQVTASVSVTAPFLLAHRPIALIFIQHVEDFNMSGTATPIFPQTVVNTAIQNTGTTAAVNLTVGGGNGTKIESINVSSNATSAVTINVGISTGGAPLLLSQFSIPANAGNSTTVPAATLLNNTQFPATAYDNNGNKYIYVASGFTLTAAATAAFTGTLTYFTQGGNF